MLVFRSASSDAANGLLVAYPYATLGALYLTKPVLIPVLLFLLLNSGPLLLFECVGAVQSEEINEALNEVFILSYRKLEINNNDEPRKYFVQSLLNLLGRGNTINDVLLTENLKEVTLASVPRIILNRSLFLLYYGIFLGFASKSSIVIEKFSKFCLLPFTFDTTISASEYSTLLTKCDLKSIDTTICLRMYSNAFFLGVGGAYSRAIKDISAVYTREFATKMLFDVYAQMYPLYAGERTYVNPCMEVRGTRATIKSLIDALTALLNKEIKNKPHILILGFSYMEIVDLVLAILSENIDPGCDMQNVNIKERSSYLYKKLSGPYAEEVIKLQSGNINDFKNLGLFFYFLVFFLKIISFTMNIGSSVGKGSVSLKFVDFNQYRRTDDILSILKTLLVLQAIEPYAKESMFLGTTIIIGAASSCDPAIVSRFVHKVEAPQETFDDFFFKVKRHILPVGILNEIEGNVDENIGRLSIVLFNSYRGIPIKQVLNWLKYIVRKRGIKKMSKIIDILTK